MLEKSHKDDKKYVSCIKIHGVPILPPLVTSAKRKDLLRYRNQAIKLEKRLKRERELREYISRYYLPKLEEANIISESLEHKLSFLADETLIPVTPNEEQCSKNHMNLSCDLQVSQYTNNEFKVLTNFENPTSQIENVVDDSPDSSPSNVGNISENVGTFKPRLIRSNSYVLETPSPLLLEHLKKHIDKDVDTYLANIEPTMSILTSTPNDENLDRLNLTKSDFLSETESELKNISDHSTQDDITVVSKDISADERNDLIEKVEENQMYHNVEKDVRSMSLSSIKDLSLNPNDQDKLATILNAIPESYSRQILELLEKQKQEQTTRLNSYMKIKETFLTIGEIPRIMDPPVNDKVQTERSMYYTPESFFISPEMHQNNNVDIKNSNNKFHCEQITLPQTPKSCSRKLFVHSEVIDNKNLAAAVIQAGVRGYLTRRLLKTERVRGLIQTIKDALICAMELHSESVDNINESDVELHRRLIQQVSAACCAFYDVFFTTTTFERLAIIRVDRERLKEKLKRPRSKGSSISSRSSRSLRLS